MGLGTVSSLWRLFALFGVLVLGGPAIAKTEEKAKPADGPHLRYARSYADAMAQAKERGCVVLATFHEDG